MSETNEITVVTPIPKPPKRTTFDPDLFQRTAKQIVIDNFNEHRNPEKSPELAIDGVYIVTFAKALGNWMAVIASPLARGLLWVVSYNSVKNEAQLEIFNRLNTVKIPLNARKP